MIGVYLVGQLGNQMFQYAAGASLAQRRGVKLISFGVTRSLRARFRKLLPNSADVVDPNSNYNGILTDAFGLAGSARLMGAARLMDGPARRLMFSTRYSPPKVRSRSGEPIEAFEEAFDNLPDRTLLSGWFQSSRYWSSPQFARTIFKPADEAIETRAQVEVAIGCRLRDVIGLHVRRRDYLTMNDRLAAADEGWALPRAYYDQALEEFSNDLPVLVFSDDTEWAAGTFVGRRFHVQPMRRASTDMFLLSFCGRKIIANSTFSWWAAHLNEDPSQVVIAPKYHLGWRVGEWAPKGIDEPGWRYIDARVSKSATAVFRDARGPQLTNADSGGGDSK